MSSEERFAVDGTVRRRRIDRYLAQLGRWGSRAQVQRMIAAGMVRVDDLPAAADTVVQPGQMVIVGEMPIAPAPAVAVAEDIPLTILCEDDAILVIDKPAGLVVHPAVGHVRGTLVAALLHHWRGPRPGLDPQRPGLVHRLDKDTSGVLIIAKDAAALTDLSAQFKARSVAKEYLAFVWGRPANVAGTIDEPIGRHPVLRKQMAVRIGGRPATTRYEVVASGAGMSLLRLRPQTGRTHQIRVHLQALGHPIVGDVTYGGRRHREAPEWLQRQALHAARLTLRHPRSGVTISFTAPLPADLERLQLHLRGIA